MPAVHLGRPLMAVAVPGRQRSEDGGQPDKQPVAVVGAGIAGHVRLGADELARLGLDEQLQDRGEQAAHQIAAGRRLASRRVDRAGQTDPRPPCFPFRESSMGLTELHAMAPHPPDRDTGHAGDGPDLQQPAGLPSRSAPAASWRRRVSKPGRF